MYHPILPSPFAPGAHSLESKILVSGEKMKQKPGLFVSWVHPTPRERHLIGFCSSDREPPADTRMVAGTGWRWAGSGVLRAARGPDGGS